MLDYMLRELATADGGFAASQDADTEGEEGGTFVWTADEVREVLGDARRAVRGGVRGDRCRQLGGPHDPVARPGRRRARGAVRAPRRRGRARLAASRARAAARGARRGRSRRATTRCSRPGTGSPSPRSPTRPIPARPGPARSRRRHATGGGVASGLGGPRRLRRPDGRLRRSWRDGRASADGALEDYAYPRGRAARAVRGHVRRALVRAATWLMDMVLAHFADPDGGFYDTRRRPRAPGRPAAGPPGQRDPVGQRHGHHRPAPAVGADRRGRYRTAAERALGRSAAPRIATRPASRSGCALDFAHAESSSSRSSAIPATPPPAPSSTRSTAATTRSASRPRRRRPTSRRCRCSTAGSRSTAGRRRSCATPSPVASR